MRRAISVGMVLLAGLACGEKKVVGPTGGDLTVAYSAASVTDGAILVLITGVVDAVKPLGNYQVASASVGPAATRVVVTGALVSGDLFKITVKDVSLTYGAQVEAVADRTTFALNDPGSYAATVRK